MTTAEELVVDSRDLTKSYASITALDAVNFEVRPGEIFGASRASLFGDRLHLVIENAEQKEQAMIVLQQEGVCIKAETPVPFSLEDVFISLIESRRSEIPL